MQQQAISHTACASDDAALQAWGLVQQRRTVRPRNMVEPGPDAQQLALILGAAAHAPEHGRQLAWRLIQVPRSARGALAQVFAKALLEREPDASDEQLERAREKAHRSPQLLLMVVKGAHDDAHAFAEHCAAAGCALQNMLLLATAQGLASGLTSGGSLRSERLRAFFGLADDERAICFASFGTLAAHGQKMRGERPSVDQYLSVLNVTADAMPLESAAACA